MPSRRCGPTPRSSSSRSPAKHDWVNLRRASTASRIASACWMVSQLFLAEAIQPHHLGALAGSCRLLGGLSRDGRWRRSGGRECRGDWRGRRQIWCRRLASGRGFGWLELQTELHRWIEEALDRAEGDGEPLWNAAERQADLEAILRHHQIPELVLQDDGHLLRVLREQPRRQLYALGLGEEGDEEMMLA